MKEYIRTSPEYREYISGVIDEYNANGKKTLLLTCDNAYPVIDGVWRVLENCARIIRHEYPEFNVLIVAPDYKKNVYIDDVPVLAVRSRWLEGLRYQCSLPMFDGWMKKQMRRLKIDVIHCHSPYLIGQYMLKQRKKRDVKLVTTFHSQFKKDVLKATHSKLITKIVLKVLMRVFNGSDEVWTMHSASRDTLMSYGYKGECQIIPNATPLKPLKNYDEVRSTFRAEKGVQDKVALIFVGRLISQKGILFVADVLARLRELNVDFRMFFVGNGPDGDKLKNRIRENHLEDMVEFAGEVLDPPTLASYYAGADLFLFPSLYDVSSIVQIEAATYKTPTVVAEGSVTGCTITHDVNGFVFPYDVEKYAQGVYDVIKSGRIPQVAENALRDIHVEWEDVVAKCVERYKNLI